MKSALSCAALLHGTHSTAYQKLNRKYQNIGPLSFSSLLFFIHLLPHFSCFVPRCPTRNSLQLSLYNLYITLSPFSFVATTWLRHHHNEPKCDDCCIYTWAADAEHRVRESSSPLFKPLRVLFYRMPQRLILLCTLVTYMTNKDGGDGTPSS